MARQAEPKGDVKPGLLIALTLALGVVVGVATAPRGGATVRIGERSYAVRVADSLPEQVRGLRGVGHLAAGTGMAFVYGQAQDLTFTMDGVLIPLDFIWIRNGEVVALTPEAQPASLTAGTRYPSPQPVDLVVELSGGTVADDGLSIADQVSLITGL